MDKQCKSCKKQKNLSEFYKHKQMKDGHVNTCKTCQKKRAAKNYENNRQAKLYYQKKYRAENSESIRECQKEYRLKNKDRLSEKKRQWYLDNKAAVIKRARAHGKEYLKTDAGYWGSRLSVSKQMAKRSGVKHIDHIKISELREYWESNNTSRHNCHICGFYSEDDRFFDLDHVVSRRDPKCTHSMDNLKPACPSCNRAKG